jgi:apolipoprotein N-acyltransferase
MHLYGNLSESASVGVLVLFSLYLGLYLAVFGLVFGIIRARCGSIVALLSSPLLWVAVEFARDRITGFPWDLLGYTQVDNLALDRLVPWTGVFGLSLLVAIVNMLWATAAIRWRGSLRIAGIMLAAFSSTALIWSAFKFPAPPAAGTSASAVLLQENLSVGAESDKDRETKDEMLTDFARLSRHPDYPSGAVTEVAPQLIAWPESPASFLDSDPAYRSFMEQMASSTAAPILADDISPGPRNSDGSYSLYNSASFFKPDGTYGGRYDKIHLVPFGEYVPYKPLFFFAGHLLDDLPFISGNRRVIFDASGHRYGAFICYESIFGDEIRHFAANGAQVLINLSDDGWYGDSSAPWEHLDMARMRAIENDRWLLRATNSGVTAAIDPYGRVVQQMPRHVRGALLARFNYISDETFYTRHGDWIAWVCAIFAALILAMGIMRSRTRTAAQ